MIGLSHRRLASTFSLLLVPIALGCSPAYADGTPVRVRGSVVSLDGSKLVVHAKDDEARAFYERFDFMASPTDPYHLVLLMKDLHALLGSKGGRDGR